MNKIVFKLWLGIVLLVIIMLSIFWLFQIVFLEKFYMDTKINRIKDLTLEEVENINNLKDIKNLESFFEKLKTENSLKCDIIDENGNVVASFGNAPGKHIDKETFVKILSGQEIITKTKTMSGIDLIIIGIPVEIESKIPYVILISIPKGPFDETISIIKIQFIYISIILFFLSLVFAYILSVYFTRPILKIKKTAEMLALGKLESKVNIKLKDEIGELGQKMNYLSDQLVKFDSLKRELISNISHELKTPLSIIQGYAETILDVTGDNIEKREEGLKIIVDESKRLTKIVNDVLDYSQLQSGNLELNKENFDISAIIIEIIKKYKVITDKLKISLKFNKSNEINVNADKEKIKQVINNLISNAINYTNEGGKIDILVEKIDGCIFVKVLDTGVGISDDDIEHIWDRYYKTRDFNKKIKNGSGLGLAIVKTILESHEYEYGVKSKINVGTEFWFKVCR